MARILGLAAVFALATGLPSWSQTTDIFGTDQVGDIRVEGNERIEAETVRSYMTIRVGDVFDARAIDRSLKSLFGTGLFADVVLRREGRTLVVRVVENPIINRLAFEGNRAIDDDQLELEVQLGPRVVYTRTRVQNDVQRLLEIYRRSGRFAARIEPKIIQLSENRVDLVFEISEGPVTGVEKIAFVGNKKFSDGELRDVISTTESPGWWEVWRFFSTADTYDPDRLTFDRELLRRFYLSNGYADFRVVGAVAELTRDREAFFITFTIEEGARYRFGGVGIESELRNLDPKHLFPLLKTETGDWYDADEVEDSIQELTDAVGNLGYPFIDITPVVNRRREERVIDVTYAIAEGPRVYVQRIDISGNSRTLDEVIRREFRLVEGDAFNTARFRRSRQRIENLGFFGNVEMEAVPGDAPDQTIIKVEVEEQATGQLNIGAGFSTFEGPLIDFSVQENNLLGTGRQLRLSTTLSSRRLLIDLGFTEPYFLGRDLAAGFDIFRRETSFRREASFDQEQTGIRLQAAYSLSEDLRHTLRYTIRQDTIADVKDEASRFIRDQEGDFLISAVGQTFLFDRRDSRIFPTEGFSIEFSQDFAGVGGDDRFLRIRLDYDYYYPFAEGWVGHLGLEEGFIFGIGRDVRISDRFFLGGSKLRGFDTFGVGPRDTVTNDVLGGNILYVATAELTVPLGTPKELPITAQLFTDIGSLSKVDDEGADVFDKSSIRVGVGFGMTYVSPLGPLGFSLSQALVKEDVDETEIFRFNFGTRF